MSDVLKHPVERKYEVLSMEVILEDLRVFHQPWNCGFTDTTNELLLKLEARATLRTLNYHALLGEWITRLKYTSTTHAENYYLTEGAPRFSWVRLSMDEQAVIERYRKEYPITFIDEGLKVNQHKGIDLIRFILQLRNLTARK
jgi:hypothetical protein